LKHWTSTQLKKNIDMFKFITFKRNQIIYHQGDPAEKIFIVNSGNFEVVRKRRLIQKQDINNIDPMNMIGPKVEKDNLIKQQKVKAGHVPVIRTHDIPIATLSHG